MPTLLLHLAGPMQSWGTHSRFSIRDTGLEPSKSGVIGLLCAALGKPRREQSDDGFPTLARLVDIRMGVRIDLPGVMRRDYHTAGGSHRKGEEYGVIRADGSKGGTVTSQRWYLSDAFFLVGLEDDDVSLLEKLDHALANPRWQIFLGRKAFTPSWPIRPPNSLVKSGLRESLETHPLSPDVRKRAADQLRIVLDATPETATEVRQDVPLSFAERRFAIRYVLTDFVNAPKEHDNVSVTVGS